MWKNVIELEPTGKKGWSGGAYTFAFIYSNKGNFLVKGYLNEVKLYLNDLKSRGYKYFVNISLWHNKKHRDIWQFYKDNDYAIWSSSLNRNVSKKWSKWQLYSYEKRTVIKVFKRFPNRWIKEFDNL